MNKNENVIWKFLKGEGFNDFGAAGILGNIHAESACNPLNLQNSGNTRLGMTDDEYTRAVDNGTYQNFVRDACGYGLCQWTYWSRKEALLKLAKSKGVSVGDISLQLEYLMKELRQYGLLDKLKNATSIYEATKIFMLEFEKPANQSESNIRVREGYAKVYYSRFGDSLARDIDCLVRHKIISTPAYWQAKAKEVLYLPELLHNMAEVLE